MTREEALEKIKEPIFDKLTEKNEIEYISKKLQISPKELNSYLNLPKKYHWDYLNQEIMFNIGSKLLHKFGSEFSIKR